MNDSNKSAGEAVFAKISSKILDAKQAEVSSQFGPELKTLAIENVFTKLWSRPGLDPRSRSLVTLGILIALRASDELKIHTVMAHRNGLSLSELEEVVYHSTGYAGFPAATAALVAATEALRLEGLID